MLHALLNTTPDYVYFLLRVVAGGIIFPYGMQKLFGWFDDFGGGVGVTASLAQMRAKNVPTGLGWLIIMGQALGSVALLLGCFSRVAAGANFIIFAGALFVHAPQGWTMNWLGKKRGEGVEYFVLLLAILAVIIGRGGGAWSIDYWLQERQGVGCPPLAPGRNDRHKQQRMTGSNNWLRLRSQTFALY